jgi:ribokinase
MYDLITIGDPTIDTLVSIHDAEVRCELKRAEHCVMCIEYGDKLPVDNIEQKTAGNAMNVAVGAARLGLKTSTVGIVGNDLRGKEIIDTLRHNKVATDLIKIDKKNHTNASTVINFQSERTILVYHAPRVYNLPSLPKTRWVYYTSVGKNHEQLNNQVLHLTQTTGVKLAYNPGTHQMLLGASQVKAVARNAEIMFVNKQEAERIFGDHGSIQSSLHKMHQAGVKIAVITDGVAGSYASDGSKVWFMPIYPYKAVERTGAGDAYGCGFMCARILGLSVPDAMRWGSANSASVVLKIGPQDGLLKKSALVAWINNNKCKNIKPKEVVPD